MIDTVIHNDCLTVLRGMADNSVDAIVTDPPAGIEFMGKEWDSFKDDKRSKSWAVAYDGKKNEKVENNGFYTKMRPAYSQNKQDRDNFIAFLREVMTEALRVLKPGGHALVWALPRTSHWTATALEDAGFEVRDKLYHLFGSGFPKSHNISVAIDKHLKAEREVIGKRTNGNHGGGAKTYDDDNFVWPKEFDVTKPATPEAQRWQGWGSALKPSCEEWILCRKPLAESSIAAQVLATGTGGINIDACRVQANGDNLTGGTSLSGSVVASDGWDRPWRHDEESIQRKQQRAIEAAQKGSTQGRFPSHLLLSHSLWCVPRGTKRVRGTSKMGNAGTSRHNVNTYGEWNSVRDLVDYTDSDGYEHVEAYDCAPDCPIAALDLQGGYRKSGNTKGSTYGGMFGNGKEATTPIREASEGFVSRYFQNFPPDDYTRFLYQSKASRAERNRGCEDLPEQRVARMGHGNDEPDGRTQSFISQPQSNTHPTVKGTSLMRWLIRLITPPDGIVLDPFCGSGSTCVAAIHEQKHFIGIEQDESYVNIANARIEYARTHEPDVVQVATKKVKGNRWGNGNERHGKDGESIFNLGKNIDTTGFEDQDGMEEVEDWDCAPDCPVRILGEQSGVTKDTLHKRGKAGSAKFNGKYNNGDLYSNQSDQYGGYGDTGTAARYFQQFAPDLWTQDMQDAEEVFIAEGGYEDEVGA